jgi:hypothetical protein
MVERDAEANSLHKHKDLTLTARGLICRAAWQSKPTATASSPLFVAIDRSVTPRANRLVAPSQRGLGVARSAQFPPKRRLAFLAAVPTGPARAGVITGVAKAFPPPLERAATIATSGVAFDTFHVSLGSVTDRIRSACRVGRRAGGGGKNIVAGSRFIERSGQRDGRGRRRVHALHCGMGEARAVRPTA